MEHNHFGWDYIRSACREGPSLMEPNGSLPCLRHPGTEHYSKPVISNTWSYTLFL